MVMNCDKIGGIYIYTFLDIPRMGISAKNTTVPRTNQAILSPPSDNTSDFNNLNAFSYSCVKIPQETPFRARACRLFHARVHLWSQWLSEHNWDRRLRRMSL